MNSDHPCTAAASGAHAPSVSHRSDRCGRAGAIFIAALLLGSLTASCDRAGDSEGDKPSATAPISSPATSQATAPSAAAAAPGASAAASASAASVPAVPTCPPDMVYVWFDDEGAARGDAVGAPPTPSTDDAPDAEPSARASARGVCVDRYEASLVNHQTGARLSPYYPASSKGVKTVLRIWKTRRLQVGSVKARQMKLPSVAPWQSARPYEPRATTVKGATPNGHVTGTLAQKACDNAGKRTCSRAEWRRACGGEQGWAYPYGPTYIHGACNVFREAHPAAILHDDASRGHSDPRLNKVRSKKGPLLRKTGATSRCASQWGDDAIYDMVGNVDEWLNEPSGTFAGGFYARGTREGCDWFGGAHSIHYADYSTGVRCCKDPEVSGGTSSSQASPTRGGSKP